MAPSELDCPLVSTTPQKKYIGTSPSFPSEIRQAANLSTNVSESLMYSNIFPRYAAQLSAVKFGSEEMGCRERGRGKGFLLVRDFHLVLKGTLEALQRQNCGLGTL